MKWSTNSRTSGPVAVIETSNVTRRYVGNHHAKAFFHFYKLAYFAWRVLLCSVDHILSPIGDIGEIHNPSIVKVLSNPDFVPEMSMQISKRMSIIIPSSKTRVQSSPEDNSIVNHNSFIMMRPIQLILNVERIEEHIMRRVSHDFNHLGVDFLQCLDSMFRVHCGD